MKKNSKTLRFDVDYKERLKQSREASNAVRLPRMGYELYRIYVIEETKEVSVPNFSGRKSYYNTTRQYNSGNWQQALWALIDELESKTEPAYEVKWLKPKQATLLRMRGHRVESAQPGDRVGHVGPIDKPVRWAR